MQTLVSAFNDRGRARKAVERLVQAGFSREDVHLQEAPECAPEAPTEDPNDRVVGDRAVASAEREIAVDRHVLESIGHFFVSLFGKDHPHCRVYSDAVGRGQPVVLVDALDDREAETAAVILHDCGAVDIDDHANPTGEPAAVRTIDRGSQPPLRELVAQRQLEDTH